MKAFLTVIPLLFALTTSAQSDRLFLSKGLLKGKLVGGCPKGVEFVIEESDTLDIAWESIRSAHLKSGYPLSSAVLDKLDSINKSQYKQMDYTVGMGGFFDDRGGDNDFRPFMSATATYGLGQYLQLGLGFGLYRYGNFDALPVYIQYQGDLTHSSRQGLYYFLAAGRSFAWADGCDCSSVKGGALYKAGLGYRFKLDDVDLSFHVSWVHQEVNLKISHPDEFLFYYPYPVEMQFDQSLNSLEVGMMFTF